MFARRGYIWDVLVVVLSFLPCPVLVPLQFIAHDREVYNIAWGGVGVFATASADGSVRVFDLRGWCWSCTLCQ